MRLLVIVAVGALLAAGCSYKSETRVERPVPATTTVVTADPAPAPTTVVVPVR